MATNESSVAASDRRSGAAEGSSRPRTHAARSLICMAQASAMLTPPIFEERATSFRRVPPQSGQGMKVTARSTNSRMCGWRASGSLESIDFWIFGTSPS